jgi:DNA-directed RNA polymerase specialized sigma24 family protein
MENIMLYQFQKDLFKAHKNTLDEAEKALEKAERDLLYKTLTQAKEKALFNARGRIVKAKKHLADIKAWYYEEITQSVIAIQSNAAVKIMRKAVKMIGQNDPTRYDESGAILYRNQRSWDRYRLARELWTVHYCNDASGICNYIASDIMGELSIVWNCLSFTACHEVEAVRTRQKNALDWLGFTFPDYIQVENKRGKTSGGYKWWSALESALYRHAETYLAQRGTQYFETQGEGEETALETLERMLDARQSTEDAVIWTDTINRLLSCLSKTQKDIIEYWLAGYKQKEIADTLSIKQASVSEAFKVALRKMRDYANANNIR